MGNFLRQCALDFSRSTCRDGLLPFHEKALMESNDFVARIRLMCERQSRDCLHRRIVTNTLPIL